MGNRTELVLQYGGAAQLGSASVLQNIGNAAPPLAVPGAPILLLENGCGGAGERKYVGGSAPKPPPKGFAL